MRGGRAVTTAGGRRAFDGLRGALPRPGGSAYFWQRPWNVDGRSMTDAPADIAADRAVLYPRYDETFPRLTAEEIERLRRFGARAALSRRRGAVPRRRAGAGHVHRAERAGGDQPARRLRPAAAAGRAGAGTVPRRGRAALRAGRRWSTAHAEGAVETILIPPAGLRALLVAEAGLGERITRALILRRVQLIQAGARRAADHRRPGRRRRAAARRPSCGATAIRTRSPTPRRSGGGGAAQPLRGGERPVLPVVVTPDRRRCCATRRSPSSAGRWG